MKLSLGEHTGLAIEKTTMSLQVPRHLQLLAHFWHQQLAETSTNQARQRSLLDQEQPAIDKNRASPLVLHDVCAGTLCHYLLQEILVELHQVDVKFDPETRRFGPRAPAANSCGSISAKVWQGRDCAVKKLFETMRVAAVGSGTDGEERSPARHAGASTNVD